MSIATYRTLASATLRGKRVLLRAGFDVPIENGRVTDRTRIAAIVPTMRTILDAGALLIIAAHQGRPKDTPDPAFTQEPIVAVLRELLGCPVHFAHDCIGHSAMSVIERAKMGEVVLLENLRFHPGEKKNDATFAKALAALADLYVNDAFTNCHREHASMVGVAKLLPAFMGHNLEREVYELGRILEHPDRPLTLIVAGSKMETKVPVIERFLAKGDHVLVGGCIANTFIAAQGFSVGASKYDEQGLDLAREFMLESAKQGRAKLHVPSDAVCADELSDTAEKLDLPVADIAGEMQIFDIGELTIKEYCSVIESSKMIIWNGPLGVYEFNQFSLSSKRIAEAIVRATASGARSIIGGGDTIDFHLKYGYPLSQYSFVSMGGGAMLEFLSGKEFTALKLLQA